MSSLEKEALDRKARLALLRSKNTSQVPKEAPPTTISKEEEHQVVDNSDQESSHVSKKPKLVLRNYHEDESKQEEEIQRLVINNHESVETVSKLIQDEILSKYYKLSKLDWTELNTENVDADEPEKSESPEKGLEVEYKNKLKLQELELLKRTKKSIGTIRDQLREEEKKSKVKSVK